MNITNILVSHYNFSISEIIVQISKLCLIYSQTQHAILFTLQKATTCFGKKLNEPIINQLKLIFSNYYNHHHHNNNNNNIPTHDNITYHNKPHVPKTHRQNRNQVNKNINPTHSEANTGIQFVKGKEDPLSNLCV